MTDTTIEDFEPDNSGDLLTEDRLAEILDERLDVEALAQMVEHLDFSQKLSQKLTNAFREGRSRSGRNGNVLEGVQREIRDLISGCSSLETCRRVTWPSWCNPAPTDRERAYTRTISSFSTTARNGLSHFLAKSATGQTS